MPPVVRSQAASFVIKRRFAALIGAGLLAIMSVTAQAAEPPRPASDTDLIIVNGNRVHSDGSTVESGGAYVASPDLGPLGATSDRDVPFSTLSLPRFLIEGQQAHSSEEVLKNDPSVIAFQPTLGRTESYQIRGFGVGPASGLYRDGLDLLDDSDPGVEGLERIDVVRGAATVLYGFASPGGLVQYVSKRPLEGSLTRAQIGYITDGTATEQIDISRRFGQGHQFGARFNAYEQDGDNEIYSAQTHRDLQTLALDWKPVAGLRVWVNLQHNLLKNIDGANNSIFLPGSLAAVPAAPNPRILYGQPWFRESRDTLLGEGGLEYEWRGWRLTGAAGYSETTNRALGSFSTLTDSVGGLNVRPLPVNAPYYTLAYRATLSKSFHTGPVTQTFNLAADGSDHIFDLGQVALPAIGLTNFSNPTYYPDPNPPLPAVFRREHFQFDSQLITDKIDFGEYVSVIGGGVHSHIRDAVNAVPSGTRTGALIAQDDYTPLAAILIQPTRQVTIYGSYIEALTQGAQAPLGTVNALQFLPPFVARQYEAGVKGEPLTGLELKGALFRVEQQFSTVNAANVFVAQGTQTNQGFEFTATGKVLPFLTIFGGVTALSADLDSANGQPSARALHTPNVRANGYAELAVPQLPGLTLQGGVFYQSSVPLLNNPAAAVATGLPRTVFVPSYVTGDVGARYRFTAGRTPLSISAYASNITNAGYFINSGSVLIGGNPRSVRVTLGADF